MGGLAAGRDHGQDLHVDVLAAPAEGRLDARVTLVVRVGGRGLVVDDRALLSREFLLPFRISSNLRLDGGVVVVAAVAFN